MASLRDIKRRITSVKSTQKITRAMKMVAASKLRRAHAAIAQARPYAFHMRALVSGLAGSATDSRHPFLRKGTGTKVGVIVVTSDRGLCGGFNANIVLKALQAAERRFKGRDVEFTVIGRKGIEALRRRKAAVRKAFPGQSDVSPVKFAQKVIDDVVADFLKGETAEVYCLYNEFKSAVSQQVVLERLLPFEPTASGGDVPAHSIDYVYEPSREAVFEALLVKSLRVQMHRILLESAASEFGARMTAMDGATRNAGDVIERLTLQFNRARQDAITKELIEVISGAQAL